MKWQKGDRLELGLTFTSAALSDVPEGYVAGVASTPSTDLYGHRIVPGAFDESIAKRGLSGPKGIKLLAGHDANKIAGNIKKLQTMNENLYIEAQLNLNISYARDLYEATKDSGGLNFSVGFRIDEFEFVDDEEIETDNDPWLIITKGDLREVSVVTFPAQPEAEMTFVKHESPTSVAGLEKALVARGLARTRVEAHKIILAMKESVHLFGSPAPSEQAPPAPKHPLLDVSSLKPMQELLAKATAALSSV